MIARFITRDTEPLALLLLEPNRTGESKVTPQLQTDVDRGLTARESRRAFGESARYTYDYEADLRTAAEATELRLFLNQQKTELIAAALWEDACVLTVDAGGAAPFVTVHDHPVRSGAEWVLVNDDATVYEIVVVSSVTATQINFSTRPALAWPAGSLCVPLLFGRFAERPQIRSLNDEQASVSIKLIENSPFARRLNPYTGGAALPVLGAGVPDFAAARLWTIEPDWSAVEDSTTADILYTQVGFGRVDQEQVFPQPNARTLSMDFERVTRDEMSLVERIFFDRKGDVLSFWCPTFRGDLRLSQDLPITGNTSHINIEPSEFLDLGRTLHPGDPFLALVDDAGVDAHNLTVIAAGGLTTETAITRAHLAAATNASHLLLVRFEKPSFSWSYRTDGRATAALKFVELPVEYAFPAPILPARAYLYRFTEKLPAPQVSRFTSYENTFVVPSGIYAGSYSPAPFSHAEPTDGLDLDCTVELTSYKFAGNPLADFFPFVFNGELQLEILEVDALNPATSPKLVYLGTVKGPKQNSDGTWVAGCVLFARLLDWKFPRFLLSKADNYTMFTRPTGKSAAAFAVVGTIAAIGDKTVDVASAAANAKVTAEADYFAHSHLETGAGSTYERRPTLYSSPIAGGVRISLADRPLLKASLGQAITLYPSYDGSLEQLAARFGDAGNFGGHPFVPDTPPNVRAVKAAEVSGGKKA